MRKLKRLQRSLSRKQKGSKNREKVRRKVARLHYQIKSVRDDILHKFTTMLSTTYPIVAIENLNVKGMMKNRRLALSFSDAALTRFVTLLEAKAQKTGTQVVKVGRFYASSKTCHGCGHVKDDLDLSERTYVCDEEDCDVVCDRDFNASLNIRKEGLRLLGIP